VDQVSVGPLAESGLSDVYPGRVPRKLWLTGDPLDLAYLAATLPIGDTQVIKDGDRFCMTSVEADTVADAQVPEVARKLVVRINGIGRLQKASFRPVEFADVYEDDAGVIVVGATATLRAGSSMVADAVVLDADGNVVPQPPPPGPYRLAIAATNRDVAEVLQILGQPQPPNFAELYKISTFVVLGFAGDAGGPGSCGAVVGSGCIRLPGLLRAL